MAAGLILIALEENRLQGVPTLSYRCKNGLGRDAPKGGKGERGRDVGFVEWVDG